MVLWKRTIPLSKPVLWTLQVVLVAIILISFIVTFSVFQSTTTTESWDEAKVIYDSGPPPEDWADQTAEVVLDTFVLSVASSVDQTSIRFQTFLQLPENWGVGYVSYTSNVSFIVAAGNTLYSFNAGDAVPAVLSVVLSSTNVGSVFQYPFDEYEAFALFGVLYENISIYDQIENNPNHVGNKGEKLPYFRLIVRESVKYGWDYKFEERNITEVGLEPELSFTARYLKVSFRRSDVFRLYPVFMIIAFWIITLAVWFWGISAVILDERSIEPPFLSFLMGLLFVLPSFRNTAPSSPPIGCLLDFSAFFWSILSVVIFTYAGWCKLSLNPLVNKLKGK